MNRAPLVIVVRSTGPDPTGPAVRAATELLGAHPGPLHHHCPTCGSIEHGQPSFDAAVVVSIAHAPGITLVAVGTTPAIGIDVEPSGGADRAWVEEEAVAKARGTGLTGEPSDRSGLLVVELDVPGHLAALAVASEVMPEIRMLSGAPEDAASPTTP